VSRYLLLLSVKVLSYNIMTDEEDRKDEMKWRSTSVIYLLVISVKFRNV